MTKSAIKKRREILHRVNLLNLDLLEFEPNKDIESTWTIRISIVDLTLTYLDPSKVERIAKELRSVALNMAKRCQDCLGHLRKQSRRG